MAINSYSTLKASIEAWSHRSDLASVIDDFITITESTLNRELRVSQQETAVDLAATTGTVSFPADCIAIRSIKLLTSPVRELEYVSPQDMDRLADNSNTVLRYTLVGDSIVLNAASDVDISIVYYAKLTALSGTNATNWLLDLNPSVYLYGCLAEAFKFSMDDEQAAKYAGMFSEAIAQVKRLDTDRKHGQSMIIRVA